MEAAAAQDAQGAAVPALRQLPAPKRHPAVSNRKLEYFAENRPASTTYGTVPVPLCRVSDPHPLYADMDPNSDPGFEIFADLDPDPGLDFSS